MLNNAQKAVGLALLALALLAGCTPLPARPPATTTRVAPLTARPTVIVLEGHILTPTPMPTLPPQPTPSPLPTVEPAPTFTRMTAGGCCVQPFFSPDGSRILYVDKPAPADRTGLWSVPISQPLAAPQFYNARLGLFSNDMAYNEFLVNGQTIVERASDGKQWTIDNGGRRVLFSPDDRRIAWSVGEDAGNFDVRRSIIWVADIDGSAAHPVATLYGGGLQAWFNDSTRLLVSGKMQRDDITSTLGILNVDNGAASMRKLADVARLRSILLSPDDRYLVYYISQAQDEALDGMWLLDLTQPAPRPQRLDFFGAYQWCGPGSLYYIPLQMGAASNELWRYDVTTGQSTRLIAASADSPFKVGNGDWDVTAGGRYIVYFNARDHNIWLAALPEGC